MSEKPVTEKPDTRSALEVLVQALNATNSNYNPNIDSARLDAAQTLVECGFAVRDAADVKYDRYAEVVEVVRTCSRAGASPKDRVRAAKLLLTWGES